MNKYNPDSVHKRVGYVQYIYQNTDLYPTNFEVFSFPIVVYDRNGIITAANKCFRELAGVMSDDILGGAVNIFDCFDDHNAEFVEAAHNAFDGKERVYEGTDRLLHAEPGTSVYLQLEDYPNAIFFPIARDHEGISLAGVLLDKNKTEDDT